jgi:transcriptional antiterminator RfaH
MRWYTIYTKSKQENRALINLERQGFECYLPLLTLEKLQKGALKLVLEPLFARYLFIRLDPEGIKKSWAPIRSTKGVSKLVTFGAKPARVDDRLIEALRARSEAAASEPQRLFLPGERVRLTEGSFAGIEAIYHMKDGESRALVLIELLSKQVALSVAPGKLQKTV